MENPVCPLSPPGAPSEIFIRTRGREGHFVYRKCRECGFVFLSPRPDEQEMQTYYSPEYYGEGAHKFRRSLEAVRLYFVQRRVRRVQKFFPRPGTVIDIGCGQGTFLLRLREQGWECHGSELNEESASRARRSGISVAVGEFDKDQFLPETIDLISLWHVIEHLADPLKTLSALRPLLKKGGIVAISTPNIDSLQARITARRWFHLDPPRHLCLFSPHTLETLMKSLGFRLVNFYHFSMEQNPYGWLQSLLNIMGLPENDLYRRLKNSSGPKGIRSSWFDRGVTFFFTGLLLPFCILLSVLMAAIRRGGTIEAYFRLEEDRA